jgi:hypothetical protein
VRGEKARERIKCKMDGERALTELLSGASSGDRHKSWCKFWGTVQILLQIAEGTREMWSTD